MSYTLLAAPVSAIAPMELGGGGEPNIKPAGSDGMGVPTTVDDDDDDDDRANDVGGTSSDEEE